MKEGNIVKCIDKRRPEYGTVYKVHKVEIEKCYVATLDGEIILNMLEEEVFFYSHQLKKVKQK